MRTQYTKWYLISLAVMFGLPWATVTFAPADAGMAICFILFMSVFWTWYGIAGLFGIQNIPKRFKGYSWTKEYIRLQGITWLMLGLPLLILYLVVNHFIPESNFNAELLVLSVLVLAIPSIVFTYKWEKKYEKLLKNGTK